MKLTLLLLLSLFIAGCATRHTGNETAGITASVQSSKASQVRAQVKSRKVLTNLSTASDEAEALLKYLEALP